ncbi:hypothetical protein [Streptomyces guryensis]|uniref:Secreted protein n=1 Tax=Streptomyces guryensis TaxID=2886947 RepID=A0A9Q3VZE8_9ACTN|nr:hypothetical protein [Streptomyces guryensis]MCD9879775.1 hypothetical protein [Streptomyces guryensis]
MTRCRALSSRLRSAYSAWAWTAFRQAPRIGTALPVATGGSSQAPGSSVLSGRGQTWGPTRTAVVTPSPSVAKKNHRMVPRPVVTAGRNGVIMTGADSSGVSR